MTALGFTGTQHGMTEPQSFEVRLFLLATMATEFHHGDCVGADDEFHALLRRYVQHGVIAVHPPEDDARRAHCRGDLVFAPAPFVARNRDIVGMSDAMLAAPRSTIHEKCRHGTCATVRYTVKIARKPVTIVYPDGSKEQR